MKHWFCCKTIICTALCAAVASAAAVTVFAGRNDIPQEERTDYTKKPFLRYHRYLYELGK